MEFVKFISKTTLIMVAGIAALSSCGGGAANRNNDSAKDTSNAATVYFTEEITPESLVKVFEALGVPPTDSVAVKISTGEYGGHNYLKPELIGELVRKVNGTIVECNTAYAGRRNSTADHWETIKAHGFDKIAKVDIMDEEGEFEIPVQDTTWLKYNIVGSHMKRYNFMINLAHFKGHMMGGFGGVLKNQSIGVASANGKAYIHTAGKTSKKEELWENVPEGWDQAPEKNDPFIESMAAAAQSVADYFDKNIVYINVMNNMSIDCDCDSNPAEPKLKDMGIAASTDPVALDKFCIDKVFNIHPEEGNDNTGLVERIKQRHGTHIIKYSEKIGLGTQNYKVVRIDGKQ